MSISAIFLDLGNTLRMLLPDEAHMAPARAEIARLAGTDEDPLAFVAKLDARYKDYRKWAFDELTEAPEEELWTRWLTPDLPAERIAPVASELTYLYRQCKGRRVVVDGGREVLEELQRRGYVLGIISNLIGKREIPEWLEQEDYARYFQAVVLSSVYGRRKPHPSIYLEAARQVDLPPQRCAYVGDNLKRDVSGSRQAGFGRVVIMLPAEELAAAEITDENRPDAFIHDLRQLLDLFPAPGK